MRFVKMAQEQHREASTYENTAICFLVIGTAGFFVLGQGYLGVVVGIVFALLAAHKFKQGSGIRFCPNCRERYGDPYCNEGGFRRCPKCYVIVNDSH